MAIRKEVTMPHIALTSNLPGISGLLKDYPATAAPLLDLANVLLRGESPLTAGERELIATYVSSLNNCTFCTNSHGATANVLLNETQVLEWCNTNFHNAPVSEKLKRLLTIASLVQQSDRSVREDAIEAAKAQGATDREIHDTVLIAAAFCMYNRYVDGLATWFPSEVAAYDDMGKRLAERGYVAG
ncbi:MAG: carboxymuconolactone decarboxylase family protein [Trueperaceae bacterium]